MSPIPHMCRIMRAMLRNFTVNLPHTFTAQSSGYCISNSMWNLWLTNKITATNVTKNTFCGSCRPTNKQTTQSQGSVSYTSSYHDKIRPIEIDFRSQENGVNGKSGVCERSVLLAVVRSFVTFLKIIVLCHINPTHTFPTYPQHCLCAMAQCSLVRACFPVYWILGLKNRMFVIPESWQSHGLTWRPSGLQEMGMCSHTSPSEAFVEIFMCTVLPRSAVQSVLISNHHGPWLLTWERGRQSGLMRIRCGESVMKIFPCQCCHGVNLSWA